MDQKPERKKWTTPKVISLGKLSELEKNDQMSEEVKQQLKALVSGSKSNTEKEG